MSVNARSVVYPVAVRLAGVSEIPDAVKRD